MNKQIMRRLLICALVLLLLIAAGISANQICKAFSRAHQEKAKQSLQLYSHNVMFQLQNKLNEADSLASMALTVEDRDASWFEHVAAPVMKKEGVRYACLIEGDTVVSALPKAEYGSQVGKDLKDFSYIYTLAKVVKDVVVEGPVTLGSDASEPDVFLFLQPIVENNAYMGEIVVALDSSYVLQNLWLDDLAKQGYDYELWHVDPQDGNKEVVAVSGDDLDFSHAAKVNINLPTQWTLSIQPAGGWLSSSFVIGIYTVCFLAAILLIALALLLYKSLLQRNYIKQLDTMDRQTGLYNQESFTEALDQWLSNGSVTLFYFVFESYCQISQMIGPEQETAFLKSIPGRLNEFIKNPFIAGRLGAGNFAVGIREAMDEKQQEEFARGLSLELLLNIRLDNRKNFLPAHYQYIHCAQGSEAKEMIASVIHDYYQSRAEESPARMLTEKCRRLIEGQTDVTFDEYTDLEMMELSKTFNQYRKQVEQMAYFDPVFHVGNRLKYMKDSNMLITYDKKRKFSLFCVDICAFSQYNDLFSADIGDKILHEILHRLSRFFGTYLYRINGDVFLGISLSEESEASFSEKLRKSLAEPVHVNQASFALQVRMVVCRYPDHGVNPEALLDCIQSALRFSKSSDRKYVIYNDKLDEMIRTEAGILHHLKSSIEQGTLEVWYQPMAHLKTGTYNAVEALVRLSDGNGTYFSAGQVVSLAEQSGLVELLGDYVLSKACKFVSSHGNELGLRHMSINLSVQQLLVDNSADHLLDIIETAGAAHNQITLEITESVLIQSIEQVSAILDKLRERGIRIALDDFGVGYSSLNYLSNLPVDVIKIDRSLTRQIPTNPKQHALLRSIVEMSKINSLTVVAEGIESQQEQNMIAALDVQYIQGFYYARPMPEEELIRFLSEKKKPHSGPDKS